LSSVASNFPMSPGLLGNNGTTPIRVYGDNRPEHELPQVGVIRSATPDYFRSLGIPLMAGRTFGESDTEDSQPVAVVNRSLAKVAWGTKDPIGSRISGDGEHWLQVVGIVGDVKEYGPGRDTPAQVYLPMMQRPIPSTVVVRAAGAPEVAIAGVRRAVLESNPDTAVTRVETLDDARDEAVRPPRTVAQLFGLFAGLALVIAVAGIGSMLMLWVRQRMREIGIRIAMGAGPGDIVATVLRQGMLLAVLGFALGLGGALGLTRLLKTLLFEVTPTDVPTYGTVSAVLLIAALVACWMPARRAARIDPQRALRCE